MEMSSFIISDLQLFVRRRDLLPDVNGGAVRLQFFRYGLQDLALPYRFWIVSPGCREEGYPHNICSDYYVFDNGDSFSWLSSNVDKVVRFLFPGILVLVLLPMWYDCFNGCVHARSLDTVAQIKKRENHYWYLQIYGLIYVPLSFGWLKENTRLCHGRRIF
jgi:hypothetical protein